MMQSIRHKFTLVYVEACIRTLMSHWDDPFGFHKSVLFPTEPSAASVISARNCRSIIPRTAGLGLKCICYGTMR